MIVHRIGCASLERRAACTCGAEAAPWSWWQLIAGLVVLGVALWAAWLL
jgi:hypothetical protein